MQKCKNAISKLERERELNNFKKNKGFTLIELLVVISIIGFIATASVLAFNSARMKTRDARRLADMKQIQLALDLYYDTYGQFPANSDNEDGLCGGWDLGLYDSNDTFISPLSPTFMPKVPGDPLFTGCASMSKGYAYYRYDSGAGGCDVARGPFYVLGISNTESHNGSSFQPGSDPRNPGFSCSTTDWGTFFEWVTGKFEKN